MSLPAVSGTEDVADWRGEAVDGRKLKEKEGTNTLRAQSAEFTEKNAARRSYYAAVNSLW